MNQKVRVKDVQSAQGMVEFALVLPILLLVVLGVFAFGHLFFVYTSVVTASREAARWGAAVGEAPSGEPRYQDCASIRATAMRVGAFAGVSPASIDIGYDHGPINPPPAPFYQTCPLGETGPGGDVVLGGDRIVVRVTVQYTPIVPLVNLPSFPISAETARTIIKDVSVGEAAAVISCVTPTQLNLYSDPGSSVVGQAITFTATLTAQNNTIPTGEIVLAEDGVHLQTAPLVADEDDSRAVATFEPVIFENAAARDITATYVGDACTSGGQVLMRYTVGRADTLLEILEGEENGTTASPTFVGVPVHLRVRLLVLSPGTHVDGQLVGQALTLTAENGTGCTNLDSDLMSTCTFTPVTIGEKTISVSFSGSANYNASNVSKTHTVNRHSLEGILLSPPSQTIEYGESVSFNVQIRVPPGGTIATGEQVLIQSGDVSCFATLTAGTEGWMIGNCPAFTITQVGRLLFTAHYLGNDYVDPIDSDPVSVTVSPPPELACPTAGNIDFSGSGLQFAVNNTNTYPADIELSSVQVTWTSSESLNLSGVLFESQAGAGSCDTQQLSCVWRGQTSSGVTLSSGGPGIWYGNGSLAADASKYIRLVFDTPLSVGGYTVRLMFGSCEVEVSNTITPTPETPTPETPIPDTPTPETPIPDTPTPETPIPDTPTPETPYPPPPPAAKQRFTPIGGPAK